MAAPMIRSCCKYARIQIRFLTASNNYLSQKTYNSTDGKGSDPQDTDKQPFPEHTDAQSGLEKAIEMFKKVKTEASSETSETKIQQDYNFDTLIKNSKLMQIGDPDGRLVSGTVFEVTANDVYVDFGGKFHCVCPIPRYNSR